MTYILRFICSIFFQKFMETEQQFLSRLDTPDYKKQLINILTQVMNDLNTNKICVLTSKPLSFEYHKLITN